MCVYVCVKERERGHEKKKGESEKSDHLLLKGITVYIGGFKIMHSRRNTVRASISYEVIICDMIIGDNVMFHGAG
jgi:hypothetical protein